MALHALYDVSRTAFARRDYGLFLAWRWLERGTGSKVSILCCEGEQSRRCSVYVVCANMNILDLESTSSLQFSKPALVQVDSALPISA